MSHDSDPRQQEQRRALVRGLHLSELQTAGAARARALHEAEVELDRIARLLPEATQAGISLAEIARVAGVSRPTLYELRAKYGGSVRDMRLAVLQTLANHGALSSRELEDRVGGDDGERAKVLSAFVDREVDVEPDEAGAPLSGITPAGMDALEHWSFVADQADQDGAER